MTVRECGETFEKCSILVKFKEGDIFKPPRRNMLCISRGMQE